MFAGTAAGQTTRPAAPPATGPATRPASRTDARMLDRVIPEFQANAQPLGEVIDRLRDQTGANIFVNWRALQEAGVTSKTPVSVAFRSVKFSRLLSIILDLASQPNTPVGYKLENGAITISTKAELNSNKVVVPRRR